MLILHARHPPLLPICSQDVYSFAVVLWELATWAVPWGPRNPWQIASMVLGGARLEFPAPSALPGDAGAAFEGLQAYIALVQRCWAQSPEERPTFAEIIAQLRQVPSWLG